MYPLFESLCVEDGEVLNSRWHESRFQLAYQKFFDKNPPFNLFERLGCVGRRICV